MINEQGEVLGLTLTPGHTDDRRPVAKLARPLWGKRFGDRGDWGQELFEQLWTEGVQLETVRTGDTSGLFPSGPESSLLI